MIKIFCIKIKGFTIGQLLYNVVLRMLPLPHCRQPLLGFFGAMSHTSEEKNENIEAADEVMAMTTGKVTKITNHILLVRLNVLAK